MSDFGRAVSRTLIPSALSFKRSLFTLYYINEVRGGGQQEGPYKTSCRGFGVWFAGKTIDLSMD